MKTKLTREDADKINSASLANLIKKVKSGKTLTANEQKTLDEASGKRELVTTVYLAAHFGVNRKTIMQWRNEGLPGIPERVGNKEDLDLWEVWFASNPDAGYGDGKPSRSRETLLAEKVSVEIDILRMRYETQTGRMIDRDEVREHFIRAASSIQSFCRKFEKEIPALCLGLPINQSSPKVKDRIREMQAEWTNLEGEFWKDHPEA